MTGWAAMITVGIVAGPGAGSPLGPNGIDLGVAVPLCLVVLVAPRLADRSSRSTVLAVAFVSVASLRWPTGTGMLLAIAVGAIIGCRRDHTGHSPSTSVART
jgi:predicted branched-subunit amino acid permease